MNETVQHFRWAYGYYRKMYRKADTSGVAKTKAKLSFPTPDCKTQICLTPSLAVLQKQIWLDYVDQRRFQ